MLSVYRKMDQVYQFKPHEVEACTGKKNYFVQNAVDVPEGLKENFEDFLYIIQLQQNMRGDSV